MSGAHVDDLGCAMWFDVLIGVVGGVAVLWLLLVAALYLLGRNVSDPTRLRDALRLLPDVLRLVRRLAADRSLPRGVRVRLVLLLAYLASPIDLVPDFLPVIGYADDVVVIGLVLRSVVRAAGPEALERHWPGTPEGLRVVKGLTWLHPDAGPATEQDP